MGANVDRLVQPRLDVSRLLERAKARSRVTGIGRGAGTVRLRYGVKCRWRADFDAELLTLSVGEGVNDWTEGCREWAEYPIEYRGNAWTAQCQWHFSSGCHGWVQFLYWPLRWAQDSQGRLVPGVCSRCGHLHGSFDKGEIHDTVRYLRADLRAGQLESVLEALTAGEEDAIYARQAMELEGLTPAKLLTRELYGDYREVIATRRAARNEVAHAG